MKYIIILILACLAFYCKAVKDTDLLNKPEKHLMPLNDTMDVLFIKKQDMALFNTLLGKYSEIRPTLIDEAKPNGDFFIPHRCLYDIDMTEIFEELNLKDKSYLIISEKKTKVK